MPTARDENSKQRSFVEESIRMTEDRDKWRKYVHGVANPRIVGRWRPVVGWDLAHYCTWCWSCEHEVGTNWKVDCEQCYIVTEARLLYWRPSELHIRLAKVRAKDSIIVAAASLGAVVFVLSSWCCRSSCLGLEWIRISLVSLRNSRNVGCRLHYSGVMCVLKYLKLYLSHALS